MNKVRTSNKEPTRRQRKREARTQELLDAAMRLVVTEGPAALTMPRLAKEADAAVGALYRYFPSKDALIVALQLQSIEALGRWLQARVEGVEGPLPRVVAAFVAYRDFATHDPARYELVEAFLSDQHIVLDDTNAATIQATIDPLIALSSGLLDEAVTAGVLVPGDAVLRTHVLWAGLHGATQFRKRDPRQPETLASTAIGDALIRATLLGWGADPVLVDASF